MSASTRVSLLACASITMLAGTSGLARAQADAAAASAPLYTEPLRPQVHFSPPTHFMNDPNGLLYANGIFNLYYQYNPITYVAGNQAWGHAVSQDLLHWKNEPIAIPELPTGQIFSGSAVQDTNNTSGFFPGMRGGGLVAIYSLNTPTKQVQNIAYSRDGGKSYIQYVGNPVIDVGNLNFRDPQVQWYAPGNRWLMTVALAQQHQILFYSSKDLKSWSKTGSFGPAGLLGQAYECPNMVRVPVAGTNEFKWVLFISINPGAPQGGSATQYFVGNFDGQTFTPDTPVIRFIDFAKDNYAMQVYNGLAPQAPVAIGWLSNWEYTQVAPTFPWRGTMTLPRVLSLRNEADGWHLLQNPVPLSSLARSPIYQGSPTLEGRAMDIPFASGQPIEFQATLHATGKQVARFTVHNGSGENVVIGYDFGAQTAFVQRGATRGFDNPFYTNDFSSYLALNKDAVEVHGIIDRSVMEIFFDQGEQVATSVFYMKAPPNGISLGTSGGDVATTDVVVRTLRSVWTGL